ncbi:MAG: RNA polymerase sigma factor [Gemmatimonadota bacterium]
MPSSIPPPTVTPKAAASGSSRTESRKNEEFYDEAIPHLPRLHGLAVRLTGSEAEAQDLLQETMIRAYRGWNTYELETDCGAWLRTVLRNCLRDRYRRERRRPESVSPEKWQGRVSRRALDLEAATGSARFDRPDAAPFRDMLDMRVRRALETLAPTFRATVVLIDLEGLSYEEAAEQLAVPVGTVKSRLHRARRRLREELPDYARPGGYGG